MLALLLAGVAMIVRRITSAESVTISAPPDAPESPASEYQVVPFRLLLSAPASEVEIDTGQEFLPETNHNPITGSLKLDPTNPYLSLVVRWQNPPTPGEHRFARLTLEQPGMESFIHVFDADGDIDDFLELPLPAAP